MSEYSAQKPYTCSEKLPPYPALDVVHRRNVMRTIEETLNDLSTELYDLSKKIHKKPEVAYKEICTHATLTAFMSGHGFEVTKHYLGLETAWRAEYSRGTGGRVLGVNSEMDALPGIGHACGHNLIAISGVGVALAVKAALDAHEIDGKVVLLGTPAEEEGGGKIDLINRHGYQDMDVCVMSHPGAGPAKSVGVGSSLAMQPITVEYFGRTAHASVAPWEGKNALDAAFLAYSSIAVLRQQVKPTHRIHGIVEGKDWAPNIIPDYAKMSWVIRAPTRNELIALRTRVEACFKAAAAATGCTYSLNFGSAFHDLRQNEVLMDEFTSVMADPYEYTINDIEGALGGSTDFGNVTYELPAIHPSYVIPTKPNGGNHTTLFTESAIHEDAHEICLTITKGLAMTGFRAITDDDFFDAVKCAYDNDKLSMAD